MIFLLNIFLDTFKYLAVRTYIIIENSIETVNNIKTIVDGFEDATFLGSSKAKDEALNLIFKNKPDIIFLDIDGTINNLPEFILDINQNSNHQPVLVALSNTKDKAFEAYKYDFFDYLLKPLTELSVRRCILRYKKKHLTKTSDTICLKSNKDYQYLNTNDILFLKADNNTTDFHMRDGSIIVSYKTLKTFENTLPQFFFRIHKSYIINSNYISRIHYGKGICILKNYALNIPFTKTFVNNINVINENLSNNAFITLN